MFPDNRAFVSTHLSVRPEIMCIYLASVLSLFSNLVHLA